MAFIRPLADPQRRRRCSTVRATQRHWRSTFPPLALAVLLPLGAALRSFRTSLHSCRA
jgi:hypothetical protein